MSFNWWDQLDRIERKINRLLRQEEAEMSALDDLRAQVEKNTSLEESTILFINGISQLLKDAIASGDPAALTDLQQKLAKSAADLGAAITANTPAAP